MLVQYAGDHIWYVEAPFQLFTHRLDMLLDALEQGTQLVFRIMKESDQEASKI